VTPGAGPWQAEAGRVLVRARVTPRAGRDAMAGLHRASDGTVALAIKVRAAPAEGEANEAVRRCIAAAAGRPVSAVTLRAGASARLKVVAVAGEAASIAAALECALAAAQS
jgi:uncharacterized protein YggU (UPF0235/DUF167 family)